MGSFSGGHVKYIAWICGEKNPFDAQVIAQIYVFDAFTTMLNSIGEKVDSHYL